MFRALFINSFSSWVAESPGVWFNSKAAPPAVWGAEAEVPANGFRLDWWLNVLSGAQILGFNLLSSVGPEELNISRTSVATLIAPTASPPEASAGVPILPLLTTKEGFIILLSTSMWKRWFWVEENEAITRQVLPNGSPPGIISIGKSPLGNWKMVENPKIVVRVGSYR